MKPDFPYIDKELSWLSFNERVLQEAKDQSVPLIERVRFLGIFSSNMDEFFKVRVADVKRRVLLSRDSQSEEQMTDMLHDIQDKVLELQIEFETVYHELMLALARRNIFLRNEEQLSEYHQVWLRNYFRSQIQPHISPLIISDKKVDPVKLLKDEYTYLCISITTNREEKLRLKYALVEIPTDKLPRFIELPPEHTRKKKSLILLDNIIRFCLPQLFEGLFQFDELDAYSLKLTRDAEYDLSNEVEQSLLERMSFGLQQRLVAEPVRMVYDKDMPMEMQKFLRKKFNYSKLDSLIPGSRYQNHKDYIGFPNVGRSYLENPDLPAMDSSDFAHYRTSFEAISAGDILLYYPYHKFDHMTELVRQASYDPKVKSIKMSIYRVASDSRIIESLIDAANNGKKVLVVVELAARFDEEANIRWARQLTAAGIRVEFGSPTVKIHSKLCLISRVEQGELVRYAHIGTGNFHEKTAKIYTDFSLFTKNQEIAHEADTVFDFIITPYKRPKFNHLIVSPINSRRRLLSMIDNEINNANQGIKAEILVKVNNLVDIELIKRLYAASQSGVKIRMIIRGMCALIPGLKGTSENIEVISIIDRFLEHPRTFIFHNNGDERYFISSADWMTRNIDNRIEVGTPIYDERLRKRIKDIFKLQFSDTTKARQITAEQDNPYVKRGNRKKLRSQIAIYDYLSKAEKKRAAELKQSTDG